MGVHPRLTPARLLVISFAGLILLGGGALALPVMQADGGTGWLDCLFTAASAVCVTGLITVDTATVWSGWGQTVIAVLMQVGGLGIMTFSVALLELAGRGSSLRSHRAISDALGQAPGLATGSLTRQVIAFTFVLEAAGTVALYPSFAADHEPLRALALAGFHAVSAFCNAGFSLFSHGLEAYATDPAVNLTIMILIVAGGLGFMVLREIWLRLRRPRRLARTRWSLHTRLVVRTSLWLVVGAVVLMAAFEFISNRGQAWDNSLWPVFFSAITPRTAGFNTIDLAALSNASLMVVMMLMIIGASPGSCGGGVKTTTIAALGLMVKSRLRGLPWAQAAGRRIPDAQVTGALALVLGYLAVLAMGTLALLSLELADRFAGHNPRDLLLMAFEAASALGTVGLSLGATPHLNAAGKLIVIALMFIGRVGPLTLAYSLAQRAAKPTYTPAEERIAIG
jgi:trk system potassium uptake protein TrkH